jgi:hypothetical protein
MYREDQKKLEKEFREKYDGDFERYFNALKEKYTTL